MEQCHIKGPLAVSRKQCTPSGVFMEYITGSSNTRDQGQERQESLWHWSAAAGTAVRASNCSPVLMSFWKQDEKVCPLKLPSWSQAARACTSTSVEKGLQSHLCSCVKRALGLGPRPRRLQSNFGGGGMIYGLGPLGGCSPLEWMVAWILHSLFFCHWWPYTACGSSFWTGM